MLFTPHHLGTLTTRNRVVMPPMTRSRAGRGEVPTAIMATVHFAEADWEDAPGMPVAFKRQVRQVFSGTLIYSGHYTKARALEALEGGWADLIGFGRPFIANPDLPLRLEHDLPLNEGHRETYFGGGERGYTDYPAAGGSAPA